MELKDFIKTVLLDLINAVEEAKKELGDDGGLICAPLGAAYAKEFKINLDHAGRYHQLVQFDVAVTAAEGSSTKNTVGGKLGFIKVISLSADVGDTSSLNSSTVTKIKFHVPIAFKPSISGKK